MTLVVVETGPLATVHDLGRHGMAALGVGVSGAADTASLRLGNRLVGNPERSAAIELTFGGLAVRTEVARTVAITGAACPIVVNGRAADMYGPVSVPAGALLRVGTPTSGLRSYLAVRGGIDVPEVLGSRSTDTLSGLGPAPLRAGDLLPVGLASREFPAIDLAPQPMPLGEPALRVIAGPRQDWFTAAALDTLCSQPYVVTAQSNRIGVRLKGGALRRRDDTELPPEAMVLGALQVPPSGQPILFLADHPVTGGYPVIAVVVLADLRHAAQARPGTSLRFTTAAH